MRNLSIKKVPYTIVEKLHLRAARHRRSLQGELMEIVCRAAEADQPWEIPPRYRSAGTRNIEDIAAERRPHSHAPDAQVPCAVDIIRADRDAR